MSDIFEHQLRTLRPAPMPASVRSRIAAAVWTTPRQRRSARAWLPVMAAATLAVAVLALALAQPASQRASQRPESSGISEDIVSSGLLLRYAIDPEHLLETIDRNRRPIPIFPAFENDDPERNDL